MQEIEHRYCLYRVDESQLASCRNGDLQVTLTQLPRPVLKLDNSNFPSSMSFAVVGSRIFMVGGYSPYDNNNKKKKYRKLFFRNEVYIYDTVSDTLVSGPNLVAGKSSPFLFTLGTKIFALSRFIYSSDGKDSAAGPKPRFEVLDTEDLESGWSALPVPRLYVSESKNIYPVVACAAVYVGSGGMSSVIFISVSDGGTYAFDVDKRVWKYITDKMLPFGGHAKSIPRTPHLPYSPYLCCATSLSSKRFSAFRFRYAGDKGGDENDNLGVFQVDEFEIDMPSSPKRPLKYEYQGPSRSFYDSSGRIYIVADGISDCAADETLDENRIVNVCVLDIHDVNLSKRHEKKNNKRLRDDEGQDENNTEVALGKGHLLKRCTNKENQVGQQQNVKFALGQGHSLKSCTNKENQEGRVKGQQGNVKVALGEGHSLNKCTKTEHLEGHIEEPDETLELKMTDLRSMTFEGGPMSISMSFLHDALVI